MHLEKKRDDYIFLNIVLTKTGPVLSIYISATMCRNIPLNVLRIPFDYVDIINGGMSILEMEMLIFNLFNVV